MVKQWKYYALVTFFNRPPSHRNYNLHMINFAVDCDSSTTFFFPFFNLFLCLGQTMEPTFSCTLKDGLRTRYPVQNMGCSMTKEVAS